mmetsp:Transcript_32084/g.37717  ORF Transcript_32084/g.37717 Transcript_32084/m.37717 type:complete len:464 (-) Transcript_32084:213-1604(-)
MSIPAAPTSSTSPKQNRRASEFLSKNLSDEDLQDLERHASVDDLECEFSVLEREVIARHDAAEALISGLSTGDNDPTKVYMPSMLQGALFCGHLVTDMDSIAGAIGAADLYGGTAARASEVNSETAFCLERWGVSKPPPIEQLLDEMPLAGVCLVDHQQTSQLNPSIPQKRIIGVIDHHALQSETIITESPIFMDIRPWGSMSTIITHGYVAGGHKPPVAIAGMLLCAIISDTLNLMSPTTTQWDRMMVAILAIIAGVEDINLLASHQFKAKSRELAGMSPTQLCSGDCKVFKLKNSKGYEFKIGFAVVETTDDDVIMVRKGELLPELLSSRHDKGLDMYFLAVVNIVEMRSNLLMCGADELALAKLAFGCPIPSIGVMDMGSRVSRKKEFVPPISAAISKYEKVEKTKRSPSLTKLAQLTSIAEGPSELYVDPADPNSTIHRKYLSAEEKRRASEEEGILEF